MNIEINTVFDMRPVENILNDHGLNSGGRVQRYVATEMVKLFAPCVPYRTGALMSTAESNLAPPYEVITYDGPYAAKLYYNPGYNFNEAPQRGAYWAVRAWADGKDGFLADLQSYVERG